MESYTKTPEVRWSDLDPNFHLRHSVYYDWGAMTRFSFLTEHGLTPAVMQQHQIGPIIFREEAVFKREIHFGDQILINLQLVHTTADLGRWTMRHEIWKNGDTLSAIVTVDGAWLNTALRKLAIPPDNFRAGFNSIPRAADFTLTPPPAPKGEH